MQSQVSASGCKYLCLGYRYFHKLFFTKDPRFLASPRSPRNLPFGTWICTRTSQTDRQTDRNNSQLLSHKLSICTKYTSLKTVLGKFANVVAMWNCGALTTILDWLTGGLTDSSEISDDMLLRRSPSPRPCQLSGVGAFCSSVAKQ